MDPHRSLPSRYVDCTRPRSRIDCKIVWWSTSLHE
jgi:hypothetical protein